MEYEQAQFAKEREIYARYDTNGGSFQ